MIADSPPLLRSGYTVVTTCSPKNFEYVKSLGADEAFHYNELGVGMKIRDYTGNKLQYAWDTIGIEASAQICADALSSIESKLRYGTIVPVKSPRSDVENTTTIMYTVFGKAFKFGDQDMPASREDFDFGKIFYNITEKLLNEVNMRFSLMSYFTITGNN